MTYYRLTDREKRGTLVRVEGWVFERYFPNRGWVETGIMMSYFNDNSPLYDAYEIITAEEALRFATESH